MTTSAWAGPDVVGWSKTKEAGYDGTLTRYAYDGAGRRTAEERDDGRRPKLSWSATGWLSAITKRAPGVGTGRTEVHVDARGELAQVDGVETFFDTADPYAPALVQAGDTPVVAAGPVTAQPRTRVRPCRDHPL